MKIVYFYNFSKEPFTCSWDGEFQTVEAGEKVPMESFRAEHFAKHLANREVLKLPGGEAYTSPKKREDVPMFNNLFTQALVSITGAKEVPEEKLEFELAKEEAGVSDSAETTLPPQEAPKAEEKPKAKGKAKGPAKTIKADEDTFEGLSEE